MSFWFHAIGEQLSHIFGGWLDLSWLGVIAFQLLQLDDLSSRRPVDPSKVDNAEDSLKAETVESISYNTATLPPPVEEEKSLAQQSPEQLLAKEIESLQTSLYASESKVINSQLRQQILQNELESSWFGKEKIAAQIIDEEKLSLSAQQEVEILKSALHQSDSLAADGKYDEARKIIAEAFDKKKEVFQQNEKPLLVKGQEELEATRAKLDQKIENLELATTITKSTAVIGAAAATVATGGMAAGVAAAVVTAGGVNAINEGSEVYYADKDGIEALKDGLKGTGSDAVAGVSTALGIGVAQKVGSLGLGVAAGVAAKTATAGTVATATEGASILIEKGSIDLGEGDGVQLAKATAFGATGGLIGVGGHALNQVGQSLTRKVGIEALELAADTVATTAEVALTEGELNLDTVGKGLVYTIQGNATVRGGVKLGDKVHSNIEHTTSAPNLEAPNASDDKSPASLPFQQPNPAKNQSYLPRANPASNAPAMANSGMIDPLYKGVDAAINAGAGARDWIRNKLGAAADNRLETSPKNSPQPIHHSDYNGQRIGNRLEDGGIDRLQPLGRAGGAIPVAKGDVSVGRVHAFVKKNSDGSFTVVDGKPSSNGTARIDNNGVATALKNELTDLNPGTKIELGANPNYQFILPRNQSDVDNSNFSTKHIAQEILDMKSGEVKIIGRDPKSDIVLRDGQISRQQMVIHKEESATGEIKYRVSDGIPKSLGGTFVNNPDGSVTKVEGEMQFPKGTALRLGTKGANVILENESTLSLRASREGLEKFNDQEIDELFAAVLQGDNLPVDRIGFIARETEKLRPSSPDNHDRTEAVPRELLVRNNLTESHPEITKQLAESSTNQVRIIGREAVDIQITGDNAVSDIHALISKSPDGNFIIQDGKRSLHGTELSYPYGLRTEISDNFVPIEPGSSIRLAAKKELEIPIVRDESELASLGNHPFADHSRRIFEMKPGELLTIGRSPDASLRVKEPAVSAYHSTIRKLQDGTIEVADGLPQSTNGTYVERNGRWDKVEGAHVVAAGSRIKIGSNDHIIRLPGEPVIATPAAQDSEIISMQLRDDRVIGRAEKEAIINAALHHKLLQAPAESAFQEVRNNFFDPKVNGQAVRHHGANPHEHVTLLASYDLLPKHEITVGDAKYQLSDPFAMDDNRVAAVAFVEVGGQKHLQMVYRSNSQGVFRVLPARNYKLPFAPGYDKGQGEHGLNIPNAVEDKLNSLLINGSVRKDIPSSIQDEILAGGVRVNRDYEQWSEYKDKFNKLQTFQTITEPYDGKKLKSPSQLEFTPPQYITIKDQEKRPDFSNLISTGQRVSPITGETVDALVYLSHDQSLEYVVHRDKENKIHFAKITPTTAKINEYGIADQFVIEHDLMMPRFEYTDQIPYKFVSAGPENLPEYSDSWDYIRGIPEIRAWYQAQGIDVPKGSIKSAETTVMNKIPPPS